MVHSCNARSRAFTLIELLVVIAIIAILAAILFPVFAQAKLAAKKAAGLAQMKQIGTASALYQGDYDDGLPTWDSYFAVYPSGDRAAVWAAGGSIPVNKRMWDALLFPYVKSDNFTSAAGPTTAEYGGIFKSPGATYPSKNNRSIGISNVLIYDYSQTDTSGSCAPDTTPSIGNGCYRWPTASIIEESAQTIFVGDSGRDGRLDPPFDGTAFNEAWVTKVAVPTRATPWRYGGDSANYVYADSHAKSEKGDKIYPNPGHNRGAASTWTAAEKQAALCATVKWFSPSTAEKAHIRSLMTGGGVNCQ